jgi:hypothetical protein
MEAGSRKQYREVFTGPAAVDVDFEPGSAFQLIDVVLLLSAGATTSENATIKVVNSDSDEITLASTDLSDSPDTWHCWRFDSRQASDRNISIDYTNTDSLDITVLVQYQSDDSVS